MKRSSALERCLVPALPAHDPDWAAAVDRMLDDHHAIRQAAAEFERLAISIAGAERQLGQPPQ